MSISVLASPAYSLVTQCRLVANALSGKCVEGFYNPSTLSRNVIIISNPDHYFRLLITTTPSNRNIIAYLVAEGKINFIPYILRPPDHVVVPSQYVARKLREYGAYDWLKREVKVIPHGIKIREISKLPSFEERRLFFYMGGFLWRKYPRYGEPIYSEFGKLIDVVTTGNNPFLRYFNVISSDEYRSVSEDYVVNQYLSHRFYINLSDSEGFGLTPYEACAYGCVPILPKLPAFLEYFPSDLPIWVELTGEVSYEYFGWESIEHFHWSVESMREAIKYAMGMRKEEWVDKSARCMEFARKFDYRVVYEEFKKLIK